MKNIICVPFAYKRNKLGGVNIKDKNNSLEIYQKNFATALISAKKNNRDDTVALVTNLKKEEINNEIKSLFEKNDVKIINVEYEDFLFPNNYMWSLAFYKLCVLKFLSNQEYDNICYLDTDVYIQGNFSSIWEETQNNILLYDINHGLNIKDYQTIVKEFDSFLSTKGNLITHYGGEFYASNKDNAKIFIKECEIIYNKMIKDKFKTTKGDEFIISLAASKMRNKVKNAGAYIYRYWTGTFRLISTNYQFNRVIILHLPSEKEHGMIKIYNKYIINNILPNDKILWKILHLTKIENKILIKKFLKKILNK